MANPKVNLFGRINRATYWTSYVAQGLVLMALLLIFHIKTPFSDVILALIAAPRLRDIGRSGWWAAAVLAPDLVLSGLIFPALPRDERLPAYLLLAVIVSGLFIALGAWRGQCEANRFGDPPPAGPANPFGRPAAATEASDAGEAPPETRPIIIISGRANRETYLTWLMGLVVLVAVLAFAGLDMANALALCVEALAIAISAPRLRDLGRSGWWAFGVFLVDFLIILVFNGLSDAHQLRSLASQLVGAAAIILTPVVFLVVLAALKGEPGPNRFGPPLPPGVIANLFGRPAPTEEEVADTFA